MFLWELVCWMCVLVILDFDYIQDYIIQTSWAEEWTDSCGSFYSVLAQS